MSHKESEGHISEVRHRFRVERSAQSDGVKNSLKAKSVGVNFYEGSQSGILAIEEQVLFKGISREQWKKSPPSSTEKAKTKMALSQLRHLLGIKKGSETPQLLINTEDHEMRSMETFKHLAKMWGIVGDYHEIKSKIEGFGQLANSTRSLVESLLPEDIVLLGMMNKIRAENDPFRLGLIMVNDRFDKRIRFEAKQKLILMKLAGAIDQRERETNIKDHFTQFNDFLEEYVWNHNYKIGQLSRAYLLSTHNPQTLECLDVKVLKDTEIRREDIDANQLILPVQRRSFLVNDREIPVHTGLREKMPEKKILKLLRKGNENAAAIDDDLGFIGVFDTPKDIRLFTEHLAESAHRMGSMFMFEDVEDSLGGDRHIAKNAGSSSDVKMYKFYTRLFGLRTENILLTNTEFLNYKYRDIVSHFEYELIRLFDSGVIDFLFPTDIYGYNAEEMRTVSIARLRKQTRVSLFPRLS